MQHGQAADVVVVGGGIVGTSAAAFLAQAGARVLLIERDGLASGASGANAGSVQHPDDPVLARLYRETLSLYRELAAASNSFPLGKRPAGLLYLAHDEAAVRAHADAVAAQFPSIALDMLGGAALRRVEPAVAPGLWACLADIGYPVAPGAATYAYATLAESRGVVIRAGRAATLELRGDTVVGVRVDGDVVPAGFVLAAAGPWTPALIDPSGRWTPISPLWGVAVEAQLALPPTHVLESIEPDVDGIGFHVVPHASVCVVGSTHLHEEPVPADFMERILVNASAFLPGIADAPIRGVRACARPLSNDGRPMIGHVPGRRGLVVCAGHGPWGISTGPASARMAVDLLMGRAPQIPVELDPARFGVVGG